MSKQYKTVSLSDEQRIALEALCRRRKVDALVWKRARAFLLLDAGEDAGTVCRILDIGPTVLTEWRFAFAGAGLSFFGLKDYSQRQGHLSVVQEQAVRAHFTAQPARNVDEVCAYVLAECDQNYSMNQTGFTGERKAWKVSHDKRKFREPFFDRSAGARSAFGA
jgi:hypothetical protein